MKSVVSAANHRPEFQHAPRLNIPPLPALVATLPAPSIDITTASLIDTIVAFTTNMITTLNIE
jgi:hypothetical protein